MKHFITCKKAGFSLLELLVVLGILALIASLIAPVMSFLTGSRGVTGGAIIVDRALMYARTLAVSKRRPFAVVFQRTNYGNEVRTLAGEAGEIENPELGYVGKLVLYELAKPVEVAEDGGGGDDGGGSGSGQPQTIIDKTGDEYALPKSVYFEYAPEMCVFFPDGTMKMYDLKEWKTGEQDWSNMATPLSDASSEVFEKYVVEQINMAKPVKAPSSGNKPYYDIKLVSGDFGGDACFMNLVELTARVGKIKVGSREEGGDQ